MAHGAWASLGLLELLFAGFDGTGAQRIQEGINLRLWSLPETWRTSCQTC